MKTCSTCGENKPLTEFWKDRSKKHGYAARCKQCKTTALNTYRKATNYDHRRYWKDPQKERERHLVRKYGVSQADYDEMFAEQDGRCAICYRVQARPLDVDHDHATGEVRGLLCTRCNQMIGHAKDSAQVLRAAADYLESSRKSRRNS